MIILKKPVTRLAQLGLAPLSHLQYGYSPKQQIQLEKKEDMKARGLASPDLGDCLAMSFAVTVERQCELPPDPEIARMEALPSDGEWHWC